MRQKREGSQKLCVIKPSITWQLVLNPPRETVGASTEHTSELAPTEGERAGVYIHQLLSKADSGTLIPQHSWAVLWAAEPAPGVRRPQEKSTSATFGSLDRVH